MYTDYEDEKESYYSDDDDNNGQNGERIKKVAIFILIFIIVVFLVLILAKGCSKKNGKSNNNNPTVVSKDSKPSIMIGRETLSLNVGEGFKLEIDVVNAKSKNNAVSWRSDDTSIASVNDEGYVVGEGEGVTNIRVFYKEDNKIYSNTCIVTVTSKTVNLESISLTKKEVDLKKGNLFLIEVTTTPSDAKVDKFIFESADKSIAEVSAKGFIKGVSVGTTTITVKNSDETVSATMVVNVTEDKQTITVIEPTSIELIGFTNGLTVGKTTQALYNLTPNSATNKSVTWKSSNENIAKVNANGVVTGVSAGTCTITVSTSNNISSSKEITVLSNTILVDKITINGSTNINMKVGGTKFLSYTISPADATNKKVTFKSSNPNVVYVDSNGIMAAIGTGTAVVTVTSNDGSKTAAINVTVITSTASGTSSSSSTSSNISDNNDNNSSSYSSSSSFSNDSYSYNDNSSTNYNSSDSYDYSTGYCNADNMITITHNEKGVAIVSTISFNNTKPFIKTGKIPQLEVTQYDCSKSMPYIVYYGKDVNSISDEAISHGVVTKVGEKIKLGNKDGYYKILVIGKNQEDGVKLTKTYYAYVKTGSVNDFIDVSAIETTNGRNITIKKVDSKVSKIYYCVSKRKDECVPSVQYSGLNGSNTTFRGNFSINKSVTRKMIRGNGYNLKYNTGGKVCYKGYNGNILVGSNICVEI